MILASIEDGRPEVVEMPFTSVERITLLRLTSREPDAARLTDEDLLRVIPAVVLSVTRNKQNLSVQLHARPDGRTGLEDPTTALQFIASSVGEGAEPRTSSELANEIASGKESLPELAKKYVKKVKVEDAPSGRPQTLAEWDAIAGDRTKVVIDVRDPAIIAHWDKLTRLKGRLRVPGT